MKQLHPGHFCNTVLSVSPSFICFYFIFLSLIALEMSNFIEGNTVLIKCQSFKFDAERLRDVFKIGTIKINESYTL
jgi:hypothetical protein